ncbi:MAG: hypothetical protein ACRDR6_20400 [Pseudonocardiaceae bacterium]
MTSAGYPTPQDLGKVRVQRLRAEVLVRETPRNKASKRAAPEMIMKLSCTI